MTIYPFKYLAINYLRENYYATVRFSADDEVFHGKIIGMSDHASFEGTTVTQLKKPFHEAVSDFVKYGLDYVLKELPESDRRVLC